MSTDPVPASPPGDAPLPLVLRGVGKRYGSATALDDVCLNIAEGEIVGLLGHNGAGKSTLMSLVAGLLRPDAGEIEVLGVSTAREPRRARLRLGLAPQELGVYPPLTVRQNLRFFAELAGLRRREADRRIEEAAEPLGLANLLERRVGGLSGGEQRRVHTAMALLHRPKLLLLDEPTAGVDVETRARLIAHVRDLAAGGTAVCYSTHYLGEVEDLHASVAVLDHGRMVARGTITDLVRDHGDGAVELTFSGTPPPLRVPWPVTRADEMLRVHAREPHLVAPEVLAALGDSLPRLVNLRVLRPSLESVFLALTERPGAVASDLRHDAGNGDGAKPPTGRTVEAGRHG
ncbi:ABC transporter ATP-binding protein [Streptomyces sp. NPDC059382]|uniref:ABC transporter ATP-binding protein n=1 Tax=Streptomyces sp. NPDC059382 TaxID=3346816 RepID=UPI003677E74F